MDTSSLLLSHYFLQFEYLAVGDDQLKREEAGVEKNHTRKKGMVLPFEPHSITFDEVTYSVDMPEVI